MGKGTTWGALGKKSLSVSTSRGLKSLIEKRNDTCRTALEEAARLCLSRTNYDVDIEHWLLKLNELPKTDFAYLLCHFEIDQPRLSRNLTRAVDRLKTGNTRSQVFPQSDTVLR